MAAASMAQGDPVRDAALSPDAGSGLAAVFAEDVAALDGGRAGVRRVEEEEEENGTEDIFQTPVGGPSASFANRTTGISRMSAGRFDSPSPQSQQPSQPEYTTPRLALHGRARGLIQAHYFYPECRGPEHLIRCSDPLHSG